jgi:peptide/nickel transport system substrate-binding protein
MNRFLKFKGLIAGALLCGLIGCGGGEKKAASSTTESDAGSPFPRSKTLYLAGSQWGDPTTFNPLIDVWSSTWPVGKGAFNLVYEPLLSFNALDGKFEPCLGTLVSKSGDEIVVDINPEAKWSDGQKVNSADVKFIFELGRRFKDAPTAINAEYFSDIKVEKVQNNGVETERLTFIVEKKIRNNPLIILDHITQTRIVPSHVWEKLLADNGNDLSAVQKIQVDGSAVVSGPYKTEAATNEKIVLKRRDDYWGNKALFGGKMPAPEFIIHPIFKSNDAFAIALQKGELDGSQTFIPRIWMKQKDGVKTWFDQAPYFLSGALPIFVMNTTKAPTNDKNFRRAMAAAINYNDVKELAVSGYSPEIQPGLIMAGIGIEGKYFNADDAKQAGVSYDPVRAKKILADAGYKSVYKADGTLDYMTDKKGTKLPTLFVKSPAGWSDWEAIVTIAVKGLREAGIDAREGFVDASLYWPARGSGDFDILLTKPDNAVLPSTPWSRFFNVMTSSTWKPIGQNMNENYGRYNNPKSKEFNPMVEKLLKEIPTISDPAKLTEAYRALNKIFMLEQPAIPLAYLPEQFYEFSESRWTGWPNAANPYAPPLLPWVGASTKILWQLQLAK